MALYPRIPLSSLLDYDSTILDGFYYPATLDKEDFLSYFQLEYGEFTPIYQDPVYLKEHVRVMGIALQPTIDAWLAALEIRYAPLENYDRAEYGTDTTAHGKVDTISHGKGETITGGHKDTIPKHETEQLVAADNTSTYYQAEKTIEDETSTTRTYNSEKTQESGTTTDTESGTTGITHDWRIHGNIGVTTSQDMLKAELDVRRFNFMEEVGRLYAEKLLILIY